MLTPIKAKLAEALAPELGISREEITGMLEIPKDLTHGHLAVPIFFLAKEKKKAPPLIAKEIAEKLLTKKIDGVSRIVPVAGYINFHLDDLVLFKTLYGEVRRQGEKLGFSEAGRGQTVVIDYSSPNVAKPMHVGHLRATVIGQAIRNLAETQGYKVIGLNHLGDWGVQFGKLALAFDLWGAEYDFKNDAFESLFKLYVRFHEEAEKDPELEKRGSLVFKQLEQGDNRYLELWKKFVDISMKDFDRQWQRMGVKHDLVRGESFYNDRLRPTEDLIEKKGLLVESEGAMVVKLDDEKMPPCLIRKSDGASLYATRDIASAIYRFEELKADLALYVVGNDQSLHFRQVFSVLRRMGFSWWNKCHHIAFGMYRFKDIGKMSSRKGQIIRLEDLLNKAIEIVRDLMAEKNPDLPNRDKIAEQVAIGAIVFNDLINDRVRDVEFDWQKALSFEGDSGPYLQYVSVRCRGLLKKADMPLPPPEDLKDLTSDEERALLKTLMQFEMILTQSFKIFKPSILASYMLDVCTAFNRFYHKHKIIGGESDLVLSRLALVHITQAVMVTGLRILTMEAPEAM
jgi:arginyl-tRNA synthetase